MTNQLLQPVCSPEITGRGKGRSTDKRVPGESTRGRRDNLFIDLVSYILVRGFNPSIVIPSLRTALAELNSRSR